MHKDLTMERKISSITGQIASSRAESDVSSEHLLTSGSSKNESPCQQANSVTTVVFCLRRIK